MRYLLDTCVLSELTKPAPDPQVTAWVAAQEEDDLGVSALTLGELQHGVSRLPAGARRRRLQAWVDDDLRRRFADRCLPVDDGVACAWGELSARAEDEGHPVSVIDGLVAATALTHDLTLVTRNTRDMAPTGARLLDPWQRE